MDSFLFIGDYTKQIQADNLQAIIGSNQIILDGIQLAAVEECRSYLKQKYEVSESLSAITQHVTTKTYNAGQSVYLNASAYDATASYLLGAETLYLGNVYRCTTAIVTHEAWNALHWSLLGVQYTIYYALYPQSIFDYQKIYAVGDKVLWSNKVYTALLMTQILDHEAMLQIGQSNVDQIVNIFPDDIVKGVQYWGAGVSYVVPTTTLITNTTYWTLGDNRDQKLLMTCIDIALYHVHCRISPRNIPELRVHRYMGVHEDRINIGGHVVYPTYSALGWLQASALGEDITPQMALIQPKSGRRIRFGGNMKNENNY